MLHMFYVKLLYYVSFIEVCYTEFVDSKSAFFYVVHGIVVDHEIPDEGMSHVLWQCYIIHVRTLIVAFVTVIAFIIGYVVAVYA